MSASSPEPQVYRVPPNKVTRHRFAHFTFNLKTERRLAIHPDEAEPRQIEISVLICVDPVTADIYEFEFGDEGRLDLCRHMAKSLSPVAREQLVRELRGEIHFPEP